MPAAFAVATVVSAFCQKFADVHGFGFGGGEQSVVCSVIGKRCMSMFV
jgi:hypothetical protein